MSNYIIKLAPRELATVLSALAYWGAAGRPAFPDFFEDVDGDALAPEELEPFMERIQMDVGFQPVILLSEGQAIKTLLPFDSDYVQVHVLDMDHSDAGQLQTLSGTFNGLLYTPDKEEVPSLPEDLDAAIAASQEDSVAVEPTQPQTDVISENDFVEIWGAKTKPDGDFYEFEDLKDVPINQVWTIVEGDDDGWYAEPGFHIVNKLGYVVSDKPWVHGTESAVWFAPEDADHDDDLEDDDASAPAMSSSDARDLFATA